MHKHIVLALLIAALTNEAALAETLIAPSFPDKGNWKLEAEHPIKAPDGKDVGKALFFFLSVVEGSSPQSMVSITELNRSPETGPVEHMTNLARAYQQNCEALQLTRPTHTLEKGVPVSYARLYCTRIKQGQEGFIQSIKVLQGRSQLFTVLRQWSTPPYSLDQSPAEREAFAKSVFKSTETAGIWLAQMDTANKHFESAITLCSNQNGEFGAPCEKK